MERMLASLNVCCTSPLQNKKKAHCETSCVVLVPTRRLLSLSMKRNMLMELDEWWRMQEGDVSCYTEEQREENLGLFRRGGVVLVATDVAGRGLDIPDVHQVINFDLPTRSIDNYCHRIGRTGRAGKEGLATSFITDEDEGIMAQLKTYLESTNSDIPDKLARHPAASAGGGEGYIR